MKRPLVVHVVDGNANLRIEGGRFNITVRPGDTLTIKSPNEWTLTHSLDSCAHQWRHFWGVEGKYDKCLKCGIRADPHDWGWEPPPLRLVLHSDDLDTDARLSAAGLPPMPHPEEDA